MSVASRKNVKCILEAITTFKSPVPYVVEPGRAPRRLKRFRFVEKSCLQLEGSTRAVQVELVQLRAEVAGLHAEMRWSARGREADGE